MCRVYHPVGACAWRTTIDVRPRELSCGRNGKCKKTRSRWVVGEVWTHAGDEDECDEMSRLLVIAYRRKATGIANDTTIEVLPRSASGRRSTERRPARSGEGRIRNIDARVLIWRHLLNYYTYKCSLRVGFPYTFHSALRPFAPTTKQETLTTSLRTVRAVIETRGRRDDSLHYSCKR